MPAAPPGTPPPGSSAEPPPFADYDPKDWLPPADWNPAPAPVQPAQPPPLPAPSPAPFKPAQQPSFAAAASAAKRAAVGRAPAGVPASPRAPEWESDERCHIYIKNLRAGVSADDLKAYFCR